MRSTDALADTPPALILLEAARKSATARVTIRFNFPAGSTVSGQASASKDYDLAPGQLLLLTDLSRAILGSQRDTLGTLWNLVLDVQVVAGEGRVLPYLRTIESSGDVTISVD